MCWILAALPWRRKTTEQRLEPTVVPACQASSTIAEHCFHFTFPKCSTHIGPAASKLWLRRGTRIPSPRLESEMMNLRSQRDQKDRCESRLEQFSRQARFDALLQHFPRPCEWCSARNASRRCRWHAVPGWSPLDKNEGASALRSGVHDRGVPDGGRLHRTKQGLSEDQRTPHHVHRLPAAPPVDGSSRLHASAEGCSGRS